MAFKIEGKEMYPIFVFAKCCWSVHPKGLASMRTANGEKLFPHKLCRFMSSLCACRASSSIYRVYFFNIQYDLVWSKIRKS